MSDNQSIYQDMSLDTGEYESSDDGWSDDHFSDVDYSGNEMEKNYSTQTYIQLNEVKYPGKLSTSPALPPRNHIVRPPIPPVRKKPSMHISREHNESNSRQFSKDHNRVPEHLSPAMSKLRPVAPSCMADDEDYVCPMNNSKKFPKDHSKISSDLALALSQLKPVAQGCDEEDGDYVVPVNKPAWLQSKALLNSPVTHKEMSERKKLPIPIAHKTPNDAESPSQLSLGSFDWFHGRSNREIIQEQLLQHEMDGMYAVRNSNHKSSFHSYSLTFYHRGQIYNFPIRTRKEDNKFALGYEKPNEPAFTNLEKLVAYFNDNKIKLANHDLAILTKPLPKFS